jgi:hypothetical protein
MGLKLIVFIYFIYWFASEELVKIYSFGETLSVIRRKPNINDARHSARCLR